MELSKWDRSIDIREFELRRQRIKERNLQRALAEMEGRDPQAHGPDDGTLQDTLRLVADSEPKQDEQNSDSDKGLAQLQKAGRALVEMVKKEGAIV